VTWYLLGLAGANFLPGYICISVPASLGFASIPVLFKLLWHQAHMDFSKKNQGSWRMLTTGWLLPRGVSQDFLFIYFFIRGTGVCACVHACLHLGVEMREKWVDIYLLALCSAHLRYYGRNGSMREVVHGVNYPKYLVKIGACVEFFKSSFSFLTRISNLWFHEWFYSKKKKLINFMKTIKK
jgi:hypothetical protein